MANVVSVMFKGIFSKNKAVPETLEEGVSEIFLDLDEKVKTDLRPYVFEMYNVKVKLKCYDDRDDKMKEISASDYINRNTIITRKYSPVECLEAK